MHQQHTIAGGGGLELNVVEWGNPRGRPILLVHGWSQTHLCWIKQAESPLAEEFRLVAPDLRGHGMSAAPRAQEAYTSSASWAEDLHAVIEGLALARPVLVGWSYAGLVVTDYLRAYGDAAIAAVNLVGAAVRLDEQAIGPLVGPGFHEIFERATSSELATSIDAMREFVERCFAVKLSRADYERALCWNMTARPDVRASLAARAVDGCDALEALQVPVLVSHGRRDSVVLPAMAELALAHCPGASVSWYEETAHGPFIEDAPRFNRELAELARAQPA